MLEFSGLWMSASQTFSDWCQANGLSRVEHKLTEEAGILGVSDLQFIGPSDLEKLLVDCEMKLAEKGRFRLALQQFSQGTPQPRAPSAEPLVFTINGKKYTTISELGRGGFGVVWKAQDAHNHVVAIKQQSPAPNCSKNWFVDEVKSHKAVSHPDVPRVPELLDSSTDPGPEYLVMEFIPGDTADLHFQHAASQILSGPKAATFLRKALETLDAVHERGILHRDLKPSNILIHKYTLEPWVFDFGIARDLALKAQSAVTDVGTVPFRPPEYLLQVGRFTDIFSLGTTLLALTGLLIDSDLSWDAVLVRCPWTNDLKTVVSKMIEFDVMKRYQNCQDALKDLEQTDPVWQKEAKLNQNLLDYHVQNEKLTEKVKNLEREVTELNQRLLQQPIAMPFSRPPHPLPSPTARNILDVEAILELRKLEGHTDTVRFICPLDGGTFVSAADDRTLRLWDPKTGQCLKTFHGHSKGVFSVVKLSGKTIASGSLDKTIKIWDIPSGACSKTLEGHTSSVRCLTLLANPNLLASGSLDKTIKIWDWGTGECIKTLDLQDAVNQMIQLCNGTLVSASDDKILQVWDITTGTCLKTLEGHKGNVFCVCPLRDGTIASGSSDNTIKLWNVDTGECIRTFEGHRGHVRGLIQLQATPRLASVSWDHKIKIWNLLMEDCITVPSSQQSWFICITQLSDGTIVTGSCDNTQGVIKVWGNIASPASTPLPAPIETKAEMIQRIMTERQGDSK